MLKLSVKQIRSRNGKAQQEFAERIHIQHNGWKNGLWGAKKMPVCYVEARMDPEYREEDANLVQSLLT